jgi:Animal haem peroxidase
MKRRDFIQRSVAGAALSVVGTSCSRAAKCFRAAEAVDFAPSHYTRMFPKLARPPSTPNSPFEEALKNLGQSMGGDVPDTKNTVTAGYTYLGQLIDHDLTFDITPLAAAHPDAQRIPNLRTPFLDLDHIYGGGPNVSPFFYEMNGPPGNERFLIGMTRKNEEKPEVAPSQNDLPRNANGVALVGDPRQDENLIIAQLHVALLKLHNRVIEDLEGGRLESVGPKDATLFEQARRLLIWHYQYIVRHDFLGQLINPEVLNQIDQKSRRDAEPRCFRIPIEFSAAGFRFGHSMVRNSYHFNEHHFTVGLQPQDNVPGLLELTGLGGGAVPALPADWVIRWNRFFKSQGFAPGQLQGAQVINTKIADGLFHLKRATVKAFNKAMVDEPAKLVPPEDRLPVRTLLRGARMGLPSGEDVARFFGVKPIEVNKYIAAGVDASILTVPALRDNTPLWYYVLKEAELLGWDETYSNDQWLGPVGSRIVANVIIDAIRFDPNSYLSLNPRWTPTLKSSNNTPADTMGALLSLVAPPEPI